MTPDEIKAVLEMSERKQYEWVYTNQNIHGYEINRPTELGNLAFRLRDEAVEICFDGDESLKGAPYQWAIEKVYKIETGSKDDVGLHKWLREKIQPIHIILAALAAFDCKRR